MRRTLAAVVLVASLVGCTTDDEAPLANGLDRYTDKGDGCQHSVSAITYADDLLRSAGQEQFQEFSDAVRSRIATVSGTIALEVRDFPSKEALDQARRVAKLAKETAAPDTTGARRVRLLRIYRREASDLVIVCARATDGR